MMSPLLRILFLLICLLPLTTVAQTDSVEHARQLAYEKKYQEAVIILKHYRKNHPSEINSTRLLAQTYVWKEEYKNAFNLCENYIKTNPDQYYLKLDYGRMLFERSHLNAGKSVLTDYLKNDPSNVEAQNMLGTIAFWQGNTALAKRKFNTVLQNYPQNEWASSYLKQVRELQAPSVKITAGYQSDTQPMSVLSSGLELAYYRSCFLAPKLNVEVQNFDSNGVKKNSYSAEVSNLFYLSKFKTSVQLSAGILQPIADTSLTWIGAIEVSKQVVKGLFLTAKAARTNYQYTLANFKHAVLLNQYSANIKYSKEKGWSGSASYQYHQFADSNNLQVYDFWLLSKPLSFSKFELYIGYDFNFSNTRNNRFNVSKSNEEIINSYDSTGIIPASYTPYFTPQNQLIHSQLLSLIYRPNSKWTVTLNSHYGFYAKGDSPYLYFDLNSSKQLVLVRDYYSQEYTPYALNCKVDYNLSKKISISANVQYKQAFFFKSTSGNLSLKYTFLNEKKR